MKKKQLCLVLLSLSLLLCLTLPFKLRVSGQGKLILQVELDGDIDAGMEDIVKRAFEIVKTGSVETVILRINTNGGYLVSVEKIVDAILNSPVKVIAYIGPSGARAFSAGTYVALAAHELVMEKGTVIGSAQPRTITGEADPKVVNAMSGWIRSIAEKRGRNATLAEMFVTENIDLTAKEASERELIDYLAEDYRDFLGKYNLSMERIKMIKKDFRSGFISFISDPVIIGALFAVAVLLLLIGVTHPTLIEEVVAVIFIVLGLTGMGYIGFDLAAVLLFIVGAATMFLELKTGHGAFALVGAAMMLVGVFLMYRHEYFLWRGEYTNYIAGITLITLTIAGVIGFYLHKIREVLTRKATYHDFKGLLGKEGIVKAEINPPSTGVVLVESDLWTAEAKEKIKAGERVKVIGVKGLKLTVEKRKEVS